MPNFGTSEYVLYELWYALRCAPEIGGTTQIWGHAKKISGAFFVPPISKACRRLCNPIRNPLLTLIHSSLPYSPYPQCNTYNRALCEMANDGCVMCVRVFRT